MAKKNGFVDDIKKALGFGGAARKESINSQVEEADTEAARIRREKRKQDKAAGISSN